MEIRAYLDFVMRRWKIIIPLFLATLAITAYLTMRIQPLYESSATYIVRISSSSDEKNSISALNTLVSSDDIPATYAKVANSRLIKRQAADQLGLSSSQRSNLTSNSQLVAGTNIIEVTAKGHDPVMVMDYANEVGNQMLNYAATLYGTYELIPLDEATQPRRPISPDFFTNLLLGAVLGLTLGIVMALMIEYWQNSQKLYPIASPHLIPQIKMIERDQFEVKVDDALSASLITGKPVSVGLLEVDFSEAELPGNSKQKELMTGVINEFFPCLQNSDQACLYDDTSIAFLMPDTGEFLAKAKLDEGVNRLEKSALLVTDSGKSRVRFISGISSSENNEERENLTAQMVIDIAQSKMNPKTNNQTQKRRARNRIPITTSP